MFKKWSVWGCKITNSPTIYIFFQIMVRENIAVIKIVGIVISVRVDIGHNTALIRRV